MSGTQSKSSGLFDLVRRARASVEFRTNLRVESRRSARLAATLGRAGEGVWILGSPYISGRDRMEIGDNVHIGSGAFIRAEGGLTIGSNTHISRNLVLYTMNHDTNGALLPYDHVQVQRPVRIGRNVWIGMNVCIAPGAVIGDGAIVGMGTVVSGTVPPGAIIGSQPWRQIGSRDDEHYERLEAAGAYSGYGGRPYRPEHPAGDPDVGPASSATDRTATSTME